MDLGTMLKKVRTCKYSSKQGFMADIDLIALNCRQYNEKGSLYVRHVALLQAKAHKLLASVSDVDVAKLAAAAGGQHPAANHALAAAGSAADGDMEVDRGSQVSSPDSHSNMCGAQPADEPAHPGVVTQASHPLPVPAGQAAVLASCTGAAVRQVNGVLPGGEEEGSWYDRWRAESRPLRMQRLAYRAAQQGLPFGDQEAFVRTPDGMAAYLAGRCLVSSSGGVGGSLHDNEKD
eukprot:jgi/Mesen1/3855/ME000207S02859